MLHAVVKDHGLQPWPGFGHVAQSFKAVGPDCDRNGAKRVGHHPGLVPDVIPCALLAHPLEMSRCPPMATREDGDGTGSEFGLESLGQIHGVRCFSGAAQLKVPHDQGGRGPTLASQEAPIVGLVPQPKHGRVQRRQREKPQAQPCVSFARLARRERVRNGPGELRWKV